MKRLEKTSLMWLVSLAAMTATSLSVAQQAPMLANPPTQQPQQAIPPSMAVKPVSVKSADMTNAGSPAPLAAGISGAQSLPAIATASDLPSAQLNAAARAAMEQAAVSAQRENGDLLGLGTRALLALQASNQAAGPDLPMLGNEVTIAYKRYLDSFSLAIPRFFDKNVKSGSSGSGSGS